MTMKTINKKLLRKIKQDCFIGVKVNDFNEGVDNALRVEYREANVKPYHEWSLDELHTRVEEIVNRNWKLSVLYPEYYQGEYYYGHGGEYYDLTDEIEARMYEDRYAQYDDDFYPFYGQ